MWKKLSEEQPPFYKRLLVWVDKDFRKASYTSECEFIYWDETDEPKGFPSHFMVIENPNTNPQRVCF